MLFDDFAGPISVPEAANRTGLTEAGARRALARLAKTGFVLRIGHGRSQRFGVREAGRIIEALSALFGTERDRCERLLTCLRESLDRFAEVRVAWIDALPDRLGEPLTVNLVTDSSSLPGLAGEIRRRVLAIEEEFDITIELHAFTEADLPRVDWRRATLVAGVPPLEAGHRSQRPTSHADREERALELSRAIVDLIERDSSLTSRAARHIERLLAEDSGPASHDLQE